MRLQKFYEWLQLNKNSKRTIQTYFQQVNYFGKLYNYNFTQENLNQYIIKLREENKSQSTINAFLISIRTYCKFSKIKLNIPIPKKVKRKAIKFYFTKADMKNVYKNLTLLDGDYNLKELILKFMFYTGVRPSELINLKVTDIDFKNKNIILYNAKGNKDRIVPFLNNNLYDNIKNHCDKIDGKVFDITYGRLKYLMKQIKNLLNLNGVVEPRTMRISFAKYCLSIGMDISYLKKLMGHQSIQITEIYAEPDERMIKEFCEKIRKKK